MSRTAKRRISVSLDEDLVSELEQGGGNVSAQVNAAVRETLRHQRRLRLLSELLDELDTLHGPVQEDRIEHYTRLLE